MLYVIISLNLVHKLEDGPSVSFTGLSGDVGENGGQPGISQSISKEHKILNIILLFS